MWESIKKITGIPKKFLLRWVELYKASIAQRIFDVTMPMIYGEGDKTFVRLQEEIMKKTSDDSILAWGLCHTESVPSISTDVLSGGVLATAPLDFANCERIVLRKEDVTPVNTIEISGGRLRVHLSLHTTSAGEIYGLLNCGPEDDTAVVMEVPLNKAISGVSDEYLRPQGRCLVLLSRATSSVLTKTIHIRIERQSGTYKVMNRRYWFYVDGHENINLELNEDDVYPPVRWENGRAMIAEAKDSDENIIRRYLARFRTQENGSRDFVVMLEFKIQGSQTQARCHVLTGPRDTALQDLSQKLIYMRPEAFGKQSARNGTLDVEVTVKEEYAAREPTFLVRLARASNLPVATVDATWELQLVDLRLECVKILQEEGQIHLDMERLDRQVEEKKDKLHPKPDAGNWFETIIKTLLDGGKIDCGLKDVGDSGSDSPQLLRVPESGHNIGGQTPLLWAAANGRLAVLKLLVEKGAQLEAKSNIGWTPLMFAVRYGHEAVVKLLVEKGAQIEAKDKDGCTPLMIAARHGQQAVAKLLVEKGAQIEAEDNNGWTSLIFATWQGHKAMAKLLVEKGAQLEAKSKNGWTSLIIAARHRQEAVAKLLVEKGAQLKAKNNNGKTPLMVAVQNGHESVAKLLRYSHFESECHPPT
ncbi:hypothetical protein DL767_009785 [Monosporascus sp. MG133]|nr:hypothetical protein DL767_009785 [Monosporascus sp. MG133]